MKEMKKMTLRGKALSISLLSGLLVIVTASISSAEWSVGIGTGIFGLNIDGTIGLYTVLAGPTEIDVDLDAEDTSDLMESAIGLGAYATDGTWMIRYLVANLELEGTGSKFLPAINSTVSSTVNFEATTVEATVGYPVYQSRSVKVTLDGGLRFTGHEVTSNLVFSGAVNGVINREINNDWTDLLLGASVSVPFAENWSWNTSANAGFGGSEGTYQGYTGVTWRFYKNWSTTLYGKYTAVEFEEGNRGSTDWYYYDVDEFGLGLNVLYNF